MFGSCNASGKIYMEYQNMIGKADELIALADELDRISNNDLGEVVAALNASWKGDAGTVFRAKTSRLKDQIGKKSRDLRKAGEGLQQAAKRLYYAEMAGLSIFGKG